MSHSQDQRNEYYKGYINGVDASQEEIKKLKASLRKEIQHNLTLQAKVQSLTDRLEELKNGSDETAKNVEDMLITETSLHPQVKGLLHRNKITSVKDLLNHSVEELENLKNMRRTILYQILDFINENGLTLKEDQGDQE